MRAKFYTFSKNPRSTETPQGGDTRDVQIFDPCNLLSPVLIVADSSAVAYNYCFIPAWGRYYWVRDWTFREGRMFCQLEVDVLASWREEIGRSTQYISRAAAAYNPGVQDRVYPAYASPTYTSAKVENPLGGPINSGSFVVATMGERVSYYAMSSSALDQLSSYIFSDKYADELVGGVFQDLYPELKTQVNPLQYISSVQWMPVPAGEGSSRVPVGWVLTPATGRRLNDNAIAKIISTISVPRNPQGPVGDYRSMPPYTTYNLYYPPFGVISLDSKAMAYTNSLTLVVDLDLRSGMGFLTVYTAQDVPVARVSAKVGVEIQLGQIIAPGVGGSTIIQAGLGAVSGIAGIIGSAMKGDVAGAVVGGANLASQAVSGLGDVAQSQIPSLNSVGGTTGGFAALSGEIELILSTLPVVQFDIANKGRPLCDIRSVSGLGGYMECFWPHLEIPATEQEIQQIYSYMEGGFYFV